MNYQTFFKKWSRRVILFFIVKSERFKRVYYSLQRAWYGYSNEDVFSIDYWLCDVIPPAIDELISKKNGCPGEFLENDSFDVTDEEVCAGIKRWEIVMIQIRDGFIAWRELQENRYYFLPEQRQNCIKKFRRAMILMARYFHTMWW